MSADDPLSVLMVPDYSDRNPYQSQLGSALDRESVTVSMGDISGFLPILREWYRNDRPDVIHVHWVHTFISTDRATLSALLAVRLTLELLIVRLLGTRLVWTVHNLMSHNRRHPRIELAVRRLVATLAFRIIVHCDSARTAVSTEYDLPTRVARRLRVVPHGHYCRYYPNEVDRSTARKTLGISDDEVVVLYFGLIREYKNVPTLISTFRDIESDDARLLVVGNPWDESIRDAVLEAAGTDDRIRTVLEYVPDDEIQVYMNAADVVALPFESVLTSGSALLAMSFGRPVILPNLGCPAKVVGPTGGFQYPTGEPGGLSLALGRAMESREVLPEMGDRNRRVAGRFDWDGIASRTRRIYRGNEREHGEGRSPQAETVNT